MKRTIILAAEIDMVAAEDAIGREVTPNIALDWFREAVQPSNEYGLMLFRPSPQELGELLTAGAATLDGCITEDGRPL